MRKAHFGAIDCAVACALEHGEHIVIFGIENDALDGSLSLRFVRKTKVLVSRKRRKVACPTLRLSRATDMLLSCLASAIRQEGWNRSVGRSVVLN